MRMTENKAGGILIEALDSEIFYEGSVSDIVSGEMMNFFLLSEDSLSKLHELILERGLKKAVLSES